MRVSPKGPPPRRPQCTLCHLPIDPDEGAVVAQNVGLYHRECWVAGKEPPPREPKTCGFCGEVVGTSGRCVCRL